MATNFLTFHTPMIRASATTTATEKRRRSSSAGNSNPSSSSSSSSSPSPSSWWSPIFGWSSDPDYIDDKNQNISSSSSSSSDLEIVRPKSRYSPGCFTEEKAKQLRMMTSGTETFHDVMYHSAIASRLASDFSRRRSDR